MDVSEFARLQVYFTSYIGGCLFLTFVAFPILVASCTPFGYQQVLRSFHAPMIMAFTTGNLFVVLPLLMDQTKELFTEDTELDKGAEYVDILVPVAFNFPNMGKLIALLFVLFGAWFTGSPIELSAYPGFLATGWVTFFGGIDLALPYMLSLTGLPSDLFNIYAVTGVINGRFATLLACTELISITLITGTWLAGPGGLRFRLKTLLPRAAAVLAIGVLMLFSMRLLLNQVVPSAEDHAEQLATLSLPFEPDMTVAEPDSKAPGRRDTVFHIFRSSADESRELRVGYIPDNLPFAYHNGNEELVGYDIELVARFARELGLKLLFYPVSRADMEMYLTEQRIDLMVSGILLSEMQIRQLTFTESYQVLTLGAVVRKSLKSKLTGMSTEELRKAQINIAMESDNPHKEVFEVALPQANIEYIESPRDFYEAREGRYAALTCSMEAGSAWNMLYPDFTTMLLRDGTMKQELVFAAGPDNIVLVRFVDDWLRLQKNKGTMDMLYSYWIRGQPRVADDKPKRWCIMRDVLKWGVEE
jgi:ABC-type amino acid transport substrate-binding protein